MEMDSQGLERFADPSIPNLRSTRHEGGERSRDDDGQKGYENKRRRRQCDTCGIFLIFLSPSGSGVMSGIFLRVYPRLAGAYFWVFDSTTIVFFYRFVFLYG
jgi:hypothetical protein